MIVPAGEIIRSARRGVGAFNVIQLEHAQAIVAGAETVGITKVNISPPS